MKGGQVKIVSMESITFSSLFADSLPIVATERQKERLAVNSIAADMKYICERLGTTQIQIARALGIKKSTLCCWVRGHRAPTNQESLDSVRLVHECAERLRKQSPQS